MLPHRDWFISDGVIFQSLPAHSRAVMVKPHFAGLGSRERDAARFAPIRLGGRCPFDVWFRVVQTFRVPEHQQKRHLKRLHFLNWRGHKRVRRVQIQMPAVLFNAVVADAMQLPPLWRRKRVIAIRRANGSLKGKMPLRATCTPVSGRKRPTQWVGHRDVLVSADISLVAHDAGAQLLSPTQTSRSMARQPRRVRYVGWIRPGSERRNSILNSILKRSGP